MTLGFEFMNAHDDNVRHLWDATSVLDEWFHRLGGATCYRTYHDSESALYIADTLIKHLGLQMPGKTPGHEEVFLNAAAPVLPTVNDHIAQIAASPDESQALLREFVSHINEVFTRCASRPNAKWNQLVEMLEE